MKFFKYKIQELPEQQRKIILWIIMILVGSILLIFYVKNIREKIQSLEIEKFKEEIQLPALEEGLEDIQKIEIPDTL